MSLKNIVENVENALQTAAGVDIIGAVVQFTVAEDAKIDSATLDSVKPNWTTTATPGAPDWKSSAKRAIRAINAYRKSRGVEFRSLGADADGDLIFGLLRYQDDTENKTARGEHTGSVRFNASGPSVMWVQTEEGGDVGKVLTETQSLLEDNFDSLLWSNDVRSQLAKMILSDLDGFRTKPSGGSYFIPASHLVRFEVLREKFEQQFGDSVNFVVLPILGDDHTKADLAGEFERRMLSDLALFQNRVEEFFTDGRKKQARAISTKSRELDEIVGKVSEYETLLGAKLTEIRDAAKRIDDFLIEQVQTALASDEPSITAADIIASVEIEDPTDLPVTVDREPSEESSEEPSEDDEIAALLADIDES